VTCLPEVHIASSAVPAQRVHEHRGRQERGASRVRPPKPTWGLCERSYALPLPGPASTHNHIADAHVELRDQDRAGDYSPREVFGDERALW